MRRFKNYFVKSRKREIVARRYVVFYYLYKIKRMTYHQIADGSNFDHATVIHGVQNATHFLNVKDREFMSITRDIGRNLLPEFYKDSEKMEIDNPLQDKIKDSLKNMGVDAEDKYAICGQIGDRTFTVDGFTNFINKLL